MKQTKKQHTFKKYVLPIIIGVQFVLLGVLALYVYETRFSVYETPPLKISQLINKAIEGLTWPVPTDAQTGKIYIREAKLTLPAGPEDGSNKLYYYYSPAFAEMQAEIHLIDKQNVDIQKSKVYASNNIDTVFELVPKLQACARGYLVVFEPAKASETDGKLVFQKALKDGRTAYVYLEDKCSDNKDKMAPYLQQMESY